MLGTRVPLLKEQQETEAERGHPVKIEAPAAQAANKRPKAGQPGSSVPPEDVHTVEEGGREVLLLFAALLCTPLKLMKHLGMSVTTL